MRRRNERAGTHKVTSPSGAIRDAARSVIMDFRLDLRGYVFVRR